jgi:hypothetical protein
LAAAFTDVVMFPFPFKVRTQLEKRAGAERFHNGRHFFLVTKKKQKKNVRSGFQMQAKRRRFSAACRLSQNKLLQKINFHCIAKSLLKRRFYNRINFSKVSIHSLLL